MKTLEQLNELSDDKINHKVALKARIKHEYCGQTGIIDIDKGLGFERYNPCENPSHYMPIAIEHCIDIDFAGDQVYCEFEEKMFYPKAQTGRAVCIAFLLMELYK